MWPFVISPTVIVLSGLYIVYVIVVIKLCKVSRKDKNVKPRRYVILMLLVVVLPMVVVMLILAFWPTIRSISGLAFLTPL